jgi:hypothetical protein
MRTRRRPLDRRVAVGAVFLALLAVVVAVAGSDAPQPARAGDASDALLRLARARDRGSWLVEFGFERRFADGRHLAERTTEANAPPLHATASGTNVSVDFGTKVARCSKTPDGARCIEEPQGTTLPLAEVYRVVLRARGYTARYLPGRTIAGERAQCFRLRATRAGLPDLGQETDLCYAADGVPLYTEVRRAGATDTRTARSVRRDVTARTVRSLLDRLDRDANGSAG